MTRILIKYNNRKLYCRSISDHVSLNDVVTFVRQGQDVRVLENDTGRDVTELTLRKAFIRAVHGIPVDYLYKLIRTDGLELTK